LAATSLYAGPTIFLSTAWQPIHAFLVAISLEANAGADANKEAAISVLINFIFDLR
jgi:hypothetical protein